MMLTPYPIWDWRVHRRMCRWNEGVMTRNAAIAEAAGRVFVFPEERHYRLRIEDLVARIEH
jgi:hypothetical protein